MIDLSQKKFTAVTGLLMVGTLLPIIMYAVVAAVVPNVTPEEAKRRLGIDRAGAVLIDVRPAGQFAAGHIEGTVNWPLEEILAMTDLAQVGPELRDKDLLLLCDAGMASRLGVWRLRRLGMTRACNVCGGIQEWIRSAPQREGGEWEHWQTPAGIGNFPFRAETPLKQFLAVLSYFILKPIYMLLSLVLVLALWRAGGADLAALRFGMAAFLFGETACAVNYFGYQETSYLWEYLHAAGMFACFGFLTYALLEAIDRRVLGLSDPERHCAAVRLCGACIKHAEVPCGLRRCFYLLIPVFIALSLMIPTADWHDTMYNTLIFGHPYNYGHLRAFQQVENWYCPGAAVLMFVCSLVVLLTSRGLKLDVAKIFFSAGVGLFGFGMLRMLLGAAYDQDRVWFLVWEEATELLMVLGVCLLLGIFRRTLVPRLEERLREMMRRL